MIVTKAKAAGVSHEVKMENIRFRIFIWRGSIRASGCVHYPIMERMVGAFILNREGVGLFARHIEHWVLSRRIASGDRSIGERKRIPESYGNTVFIHIVRYAAYFASYDSSYRQLPAGPHYPRTRVRYTTI